MPYTHKIIIFKLFRSLQLQFSGPTRINFRYSYSFVGLTGIFLYRYSSVQLHKKMVRGIIFRKLQLQLHKKWFSNSRQFLTRNYPRPNCLLKCLPNCLSPTREGFLSSFKINPAVRVIARQVRDKNCLAAIFAPRHQSVSSGTVSSGHHSLDTV